MTRKKTLLAVLTAGLLTVGAAPIAHADDLITPESGHRPGYYGWNSVQLGADTTDPRTGAAHTCAGRTLLYQAHVDAIYGTRNKGNMDVMVVDGQVPRPADELCLRLGPDADNSGREISRFVVPKEDKFSFLGKPGTILWNAPQATDWTDNWRPLWAGIGAFDPQHEYEVPNEFENGLVEFELVDFKGPGEMETFFASTISASVKRMLSTKDGIKSFTYEVGYHGHFGWTFTKPGIYQMSVRVKGTHKDTGEVEQSPVRTVTWLVGSDEQVGLPDGTTKGLRSIQQTAEEQRDAAGLPAQDDSSEPEQPADPAPTEPEPTDPQPEDPAPTEPDLTPAQRNQRAAEAIAKKYGASHPNASDLHIVDKGHMDLAVETRDGKHVGFLKDSADPTNVAERPSGTFGFRVDSPNAHLQLNQQVKDALKAAGATFGDTAWVTPMAQQDDPASPWLGFSTDHLDYSKVNSDSVTMKIAEFDGPGEMVTAHSEVTDMKVELHSGNLGRVVEYPSKAHDHQAFLFSKPGVYRVVFEYSGTNKDGSSFSVPLETFFSVGDATSHPSEEGGETTTPSPTEPSPSDPGQTDPGQPSNPTQPSGSNSHWLADGDVPILEFAKGVDGVLKQLNKDLISLDNSLSTIERIGNKWFGKELSAKKPASASRPSGQGGAQSATGENQSTTGGTSTGAATGAGNGAHNAGQGTTSSAGTGEAVGGTHPLATSLSTGTSGGSSSMGTPVVSNAAVTSSSESTGSALSGESTEGTDVEDAATEEASADTSADAGQASGEGLGIRALPNEGTGNSQASAQHSADKGKFQLLADNLQQGGWLGGFTLGVGLMALLGGMLLVLLASRNLRAAQALVANQRAQRAGQDAD